MQHHLHHTSRAAINSQQNPHPEIAEPISKDSHVHIYNCGPYNSVQPCCAILKAPLCANWSPAVYRQNNDLLWQAIRSHAIQIQQIRRMKANPSVWPMLLLSSPTQSPSFTKGELTRIPATGCLRSTHQQPANVPRDQYASQYGLGWNWSSLGK